MQTVATDPGGGLRCQQHNAAVIANSRQPGNKLASRLANAVNAASAAMTRHTAWRPWLLCLMLGLLGQAGGATAQTCSPYQGQVTINELRIGRSGGSDTKNQIELFNGGNVPQAIWSGWQLVVYVKESVRASVRKGGYYLSTNTNSDGQFIFTSQPKQIYLRNKNTSFSDVALIDANGGFIDYVAIEGVIQSVPACLGAPGVVNATASSDASGNVSRLPNGGALPAAVTTTSSHTIGTTNVCTAGGSDLFVSHNADISTPVATKTEIGYTTTVTNLSCSNTVTGVAVTVTGIADSNPGGFSGLAKNTTQGSTSSVNDSPLVWTVGTLAPGATATLTVTGKPRTPGTVNSSATISAPASGLINTSNDSDTESVGVQQWNWVGFDVASDTVTEGQNSFYTARISAAVMPSNDITVNYSVSGSSTATDTDLAATGTLVIDKDDLNAPDSTTIEFTITNDLIPEPTKGLTLTITSVTSGDNMVRFDSGSVLYTPSMAITLLDDDGPDHYELSLPSTGLSCLPLTVTVSACLNASSPCTSPYPYVTGYTATVAASAGSLAATTLTFNASGVASTTLSHASAIDGATLSVTLSGEQRASVNPRKCCPNGSNCVAGNSCSSTFNSAGFIIAAAANGGSTTLPTQTAGTASAGYTLRAVKTNTTTKACEAALAGANSVNWATQCNNPSSCSAGNRLTLTGSSAVAIAGNPSSGVVSSTAVPMTFDANGNAPFSFNFADVGQITLHAAKSAGGTLTSALAGSSNAFVVKPAGFVLSAVKCGSYTAGNCATSVITSPGNNPGAASASGTAFMPAASAFSATVTAVDSLGNATPNFGLESTPEGVTLTATLVQPSGGNAPALSNPGAFGAFSAGAATGTTFAWPEVGIITLTPRLADASYLGVGDVVGTISGPVGRFVAHHFDITATPACGSFSYAAQPFSATVTARNASNNTTVNYAGSGPIGPYFAKTITLSEPSALGVGSLSGNTLAVSAFTAGVASASPRYTFTTKTTSARTLALRATDTDSASSAGYTEASMPLRSGRLRLNNVFGSASAALQMPVVAEYWSGNSWVLNSADSCTTLAAASVALSNPRNAAGNASAATSSASAVTLSSGNGLLTLAAPSPSGSSLSLDIAINLGSGAADQSCQASHPVTTGAAKPWLRALNGSCAASADRDPAARASFGLFSPESRKTVHVRELF